jgi:signal transduction histidine kinase
LQKVTEAALSHISLSELLDDLLPKICDAMSADACVVFLADHERRELYSLTGFARNGLPAPPQARLPFGESFAGRVADERRLVTVRHVTSDPTLRPQVRAFGADSAAGVPLLSGQRLIGVLVVASRADRLFNRDETNLLELVGQRFTRAIVNTSLYEDAREANRVKDRLLSVASHELRAPITGILGWISLLRTETDPEIRAEALGWIEQSARTQAQLVSDLLDMTRIREGKVELHRETIDVRDAVQTAIRVVEAQARERGVIIEASMPEQPVTVAGDATRLQQVVWNLLGNAVKFTPAGKHVRASVDATESTARITVADEGEGIKPEFLPHVFSAFEQDSNGKRAGGLGLGLHIVSTIVAMHGGTIEAMSDGPGRGATFAVTLPFLAAG